jgi:hypothetical protein
MRNYPGDGFKHMTTDAWKSKKMSDVTIVRPTHTAHTLCAQHGGGSFRVVSVSLTESKRIDPPTKQTPEPQHTDTLHSMAQELAAQNPLSAPRQQPIHASPRMKS